MHDLEPIRELLSRAIECPRFFLSRRATANVKIEAIAARIVWQDSLCRVNHFFLACCLIKECYYAIIVVVRAGVEREEGLPLLASV